MPLLFSLFNALRNLFQRRTSPYKILERFNQIRNNETVINQTKMSNRAKLICQILKENDIRPVIDHQVLHKIGDNGIHVYNIIVHFGIVDDSDRVVHSVHHDVRNLQSMNVLDNTASIANILALIIDLKKKKLKVKTSFVFTDGEEFGGFGAEIVAKQINKGEFGNVLGVVVHELTGAGKIWTNEYLNKEFLTYKLCEIDSEMVEHWTPWNDVSVYNDAKINAICLGTMPDDQMAMLQKNGSCTYWSKCHQSTDDMGFANEKDMKKYVQQLKQFSR